MPHID
ncbi:hypothetical protein VCCP103710_1703, partial [Vibrio cholerae CP1037(10)]